MSEQVLNDIEINESSKPKKYKSQKRAKLTSTIVSYILLVILSIIWLYPILWIVLHSFRLENNEVPVGWYFPKTYGFQNYIDLFKETLFMRWFGNTLLVAVCSCVLSTILILSVAYCMSKLRFKMRKPFMNISMILGLFPGFMSMAAIYFILQALKLTGDGNLWALILCNSAGAGLGFYVAKGFFDVIPNSLMESARLDGATNAQIFWHIIFYTNNNFL